MEVTIEIKHVNGMSKPKVTIEDGQINYVLPFEVQLPPGTFDRITNLFRQRVPVQLTISSPQAKMDLFTEVFSDTARASWTEDEIGALRENAKTCLRTSERAERLAAESGDLNDREVAEAAAQSAAEAVTKAAGAIDISENVLLTNLSEEVRQDMLDEGERQADDTAAEEGAAAFAADEPGRCESGCSDGGDGKCHFCGYPMPVDPEELQRQIAEHAAESEAAAGGDGSGNDSRIPEKPKRQRKARQTA